MAASACLRVCGRSLFQFRCGETADSSVQATLIYEIGKLLFFVSLTMNVSSAISHAGKLGFRIHPM